MGTGDVARAFHESTKHTVESLRRDTRSLDWSNKPFPFKEYVSELRDVAVSPAVEHILRYGAGVLRKQDYGGEKMYFRTYASAGALYPVELYVVDASGVSHFHPLHRSFARLRDGDHLGIAASACGGERSVATAETLLVLTGIPWRTCWKYGERGYRHLWWDAGTILANILALSAAAALPARVVLAFDDGDISRLVDVDGAREFPLCIVALGAGDARAPIGDGSARLDLAVKPLSAREDRFPELERVHEAGNLRSDDVAGWRGDSREIDVAPDDGSDIERVIRKRGSARRFGRRPIPAAHIEQILDRATRVFPTDYSGDGATLIRPYLVVHNVDGMVPGAYVWQSGRLKRLREGDMRLDAAYLCLGQRLGGNAAVTLFLTADLDHALARYGDRGYRIVQLEGGVTLGRLDLGAHRLGWGATGLTFFDDDVIDFFSPHAAGRECMLASAVGERRGKLLPLA